MPSTFEKKLIINKAYVTSLASLSKCSQRGVATILCAPDFSQIVSIGVNGGVKGGAQCLCVLPGKETCIHAEINCLIKCSVPTEGLVMLCSLSPCKQCATAIINAGISKVYYVDEWKSDLGIQLLKSAGVQVINI